MTGKSQRQWLIWLWPKFLPEYELWLTSDKSISLPSFDFNVNRIKPNSLPYFDPKILPEYATPPLYPTLSLTSTQIYSAIDNYQPHLSILPWP